MYIVPIMNHIPMFQLYLRSPLTLNVNGTIFLIFRHLISSLHAFRPPPFPSKPTPRLRFHTYFPYRRIHSNLTERVNIIVIRLYNRDNTYILNMFHHSYNLKLMSNLRIQFIYINSKWSVFHSFIINFRLDFFSSSVYFLWR